MSAEMRWLEPWYPVDDEAVRRGLEAELRRELSDAHVLAGEPATLIARRGDVDDALYLLGDGRVAEVHLTWARHPEPDPRWPATAIHASLQDWVERSMIPTHAMFAAGD